MLFSRLFAVAASVASATAQTTKGYNYASTNTDGSPRVQAQWTDAFNTAQGVAGAPGFSSARLYTMIQAGTTNTPIEAIPAAISTGTTLLLGLWASAGQASMTNEIQALQAAISQYGTAFIDLIVGISVGSEDLYRISPTGINNLSGPGTGPDVIANYIAQVRAAIAGTAAAGKLVGHVDTWTAFVNSSNAAAISAADFLGMDAYPYYETTNGNDISNALALFNSAYSQTVAAAQGKPVWVTETGWPTSGATLAQAVPNSVNAKTYWDQIGCGVLFGKINTWWFTLEDPAFGVVGNSLTTTPLYDLTCPASTSVYPLYSPPVPSSSSTSSKASTSSATNPLATTQSTSRSSIILSTSMNSTLTTPTASAVSSTSKHKSRTRPHHSTFSTFTPLQASSSPLPSSKSYSANFLGPYLPPNLIIPISRSSPNTTSETGYYGYLSPTTSTVFTFDIPAPTPNQTCSLLFLLPTTMRYTLTRSGGLVAYSLHLPITGAASYLSLGRKTQISEVAEVGQNTSVVLSSELCKAGKRSFLLESNGTLNVTFFQTRGNPAVGAWVRMC